MSLFSKAFIVSCLIICSGLINSTNGLVISHLPRDQEWNFAATNFVSTQYADTPCDPNTAGQDVHVSFHVTNLFTQDSASSANCHSDFHLTPDPTRQNPFQGYPIDKPGAVGLCDDPGFVWYYTSFQSLCDFAVNVDHFWLPAAGGLSNVFFGNGSEVDVGSNPGVVSVVNNGIQTVTLSGTLIVPIVEAIG